MNNSNTCLRFVILPFLLLSFIFSSLASNKPAQESNMWMNYYYKDPQPQKIIPMFSLLLDKGLINNDSQNSAMFIYMSQIILKHPELANDFVKIAINRSEDERLYVAAILSNGKAKDIAELMKKDLKLSDRLIHQIGQISAYDPRNDIIVSPKNLDMLWAVFMVTGDEKPVNMIIDYLLTELPARKEGKDNSQRIMLIATIGAAKWSLAAMSNQDENVALILKNRYQTGDEALKKQLEPIMVQINNKEKTSG